VRQYCPDHTVILSGDGYSEISHLLELPVFDDPAIVYNFHLYDPMIVSHQSAYFTEDWVKAVVGLEYPTQRDNVDVLLTESLPDRTIAELRSYREEPWDLDRYRTHLVPAVEFAEQRGVPLTCNEFGIYRAASRETRSSWLGHVSRALSDAGIGWSVWDYAGDFAVASGPAGQRIPDLAMTGALGLVGSPVERLA
jgi:endoglucanase